MDPLPSNLKCVEAKVLWFKGKLRGSMLQSVEPLSVIVYWNLPDQSQAFEKTDSKAGQICLLFDGQ